MESFRLAILAVIWALCATSVSAQMTLDGSMGPAGALTGPDFSIAHTDGTTLGTNLFHSFGAFNIQAGESATFTGPGAIDNVISRVTGGDASHINGLLRSTIPSADLFLINPAGLVFKDNASLDVRGSFYGSTADQLRLSDGGVFDARTPSDTVLTTAPPAAFGFLNSNPAAISVQGSTLEMHRGKTLALVGGNVKVGDATVTLPAGQLDLVALRSPGEVPVNGTRVIGTSQLGDVTLAGSVVNLDGDPGGGLYIRGGNIVLDNTRVVSTTTGDTHGKPVRLVGGDVLLTRGGEIRTVTQAGGDGGDITVELSGELVVDPDGLERRNGLRTWTYDAGDSGDIVIAADRVDIDGEGIGPDDPTGLTSGITVTRIGTENGATIVGTLDEIVPGGTGKGGDTTITAREVVLRDSARIQNGTFGAGDAGDIIIDATRIFMDGVDENPNLPTGIRSRVGFGSLGVAAGTSITGDAGDIRITVQSLEMVDGVIATDSNGAGNGGLLAINADSIVASHSSGITSDARLLGDGGEIQIQTRELLLLGGDRFTQSILRADADDDSTGDAGDITIRAENVEVRGGSEIGAVTQGTGAAGNVLIESDHVLVSDDGVVDNATLIRVFTVFNPEAGDGGDITIKAGVLEVRGGGISSASIFSGGAAGNVIIDADTVLVEGRGEPAPRLVFPPIDISLIQSNSIGENSGPAGIVNITAGELKITRGGAIQSGTVGSGAGGGVIINAEQVFMESKGSIDVGTSASGAGGTITVNTRDLQITGGARIDATTLGSGNGGSVELSVSQLLRVDGVGSGVFTGTESEGPDAGRAGEIRITAGELDVRGGSVDAVTRSAGAGGSVVIDAGQIRVQGRGEAAPDVTDGEVVEDSLIRASSIGANSGPAGDVRISADRLDVVQGGAIQSETRSVSDGGAVVIRAGQVHMDSRGSIDAGTSASGQGGAITLSAGDLRLETGARIDATTTSTGSGGSVDLAVSNVLGIDGAGSGVFTGSESPVEDAGRAGDIRISANELLLSDQAQISTQSAAADGGNIQVMVTQLVDLFNSEMTTSVGTGQGAGGNIFIDPRFVVLHNGRIIANAFGGPGGNIEIIAENFLADLDSVVEASSQLGVSGNVNISSPDTDVTSGITVLPGVFLDASTLLQAPCEARAAGGLSSLAAAGRSGLPASADGYLPSPGLVSSKASAASSRNTAMPVATSDRRAAAHTMVSLGLEC